jgi:hypothetical protein
MEILIRTTFKITYNDRILQAKFKLNVNKISILIIFITKFSQTIKKWIVFIITWVSKLFSLDPFHQRILMKMKKN